MKPLHILTISILLTLVLLSACGATPPQELPRTEAQPQVINPEENTSLSKPENTTSLVPSQEPVGEQDSVNNSSPIPRELAEKVKADLAAYLNINADQIKVVEAQAVEWPDTSLGCPQPEMAYAQVITPGYWFLLEAQGKPYPYHTDQKEQIVLCLANPSDANQEKPLPIIPVNPDEIDDGQPWVPVN